VVLQPGTVVSAQVLKIISADLVRIVIADLSIDVTSQVPLQAGQTLQLAVSQTPDGVRLAVVGQGPPAGVPAEAIPLAPDLPVAATANAPATTAPVGNVLTPPQQAAVAAVTQTAAAQQASLAPLFANLGTVAAGSGLPPQLQQAVLQVLSQQTPLDPNLDGNAIKAGFQKSGLFLESVLASGSVASATGLPDLKAALIVLRQALSTSLGSSETVAQSSDAAPLPQATPTPAATLAPSPSSSSGAQQVLLPEARVVVADDLAQPLNTGRLVLTTALLEAEPQAATTSAVLTLLQEGLQQVPSANTSTSPVAIMPKGQVIADDVTVHTNTPPPPFRGALPSAQPVASPSIAANTPLAATARHLLGDTDAAIARQTLLQVASLPDRVDASATRLDQTSPKWNFEIPFATPQGTAMAQFEISRDGGGNEVEAAKRVWRARFSIDVEPAGPVHALVSLAGERTSVRMWAERPATAAQLRAGANELGQALTKAELQPGDIVIRDGAPPQPAQPPAGHFLDRAS
jgi:hypothetical protein